MSRIIGCQGLHIAEVTKDDVAGSTWGTPVPVPSLISIDIADNSENVTFYSDDTVEQVIPSFTGKEITVTLGHISNELEAMISGNTYENGVFTQNANATAKEFALMFKAPKSKNGAFQYVCLYKGVLARTESNYKTKEDSVESSDVTLEGVFMPLQSNGKVAIKADSDDESPSALIGTWFTKVPVVEPAIVKASK